MHYIVSNEYSRYFEVADDRQITIGSLDFSTWVRTAADVSLSDGNSYRFEPAGFWNNTMTLSKGDTIIAELKYNWNAQITITFATGRAFIFRRQKRWSGDWILLNETEDAIGIISASYKWSTLGFDYDIQVEPVTDRETNILLPFLLIYCIRYMRIRGVVVV